MFKFEVNVRLAQGATPLSCAVPATSPLIALARAWQKLNLPKGLKPGTAFAGTIGIRNAGKIVMVYKATYHPAVDHVSWKEVAHFTFDSRWVVPGQIPEGFYQSRDEAKKAAAPAEVLS